MIAFSITLNNNNSRLYPLFQIFTIEQKKLKILTKMQGNSAQSLQLKMQAFTDQINDLIHATSLNLLALRTQTNGDEDIDSLLCQTQKQFDHAVKLFKERQELRLNYLIIQQIKQEEAKVRRERLMEYEQKIYDQRRLISDKEAFYESLLKPKRKKPANMTPEQYTEMRKKEADQQQEKHLGMMNAEISQLEKLEAIVNFENKKLQSYINDSNDYQSGLNSSQKTLSLATLNPNIYAIIKKQGLPPKQSEIRDIIGSVYVLKDTNRNAFNQLIEQRQMEQYLKWERTKLLEEYQNLTQKHKYQHQKKKENTRVNRLFAQIKETSFVRPVSL